jgi:membrane protein YqaA with SNARE-associated domain
MDGWMCQVIIGVGVLALAWKIKGSLLVHHLSNVLGSLWWWIFGIILKKSVD